MLTDQSCLQLVEYFDSVGSHSFITRRVEADCMVDTQAMQRLLVVETLGPLSTRLTSIASLEGYAVRARLILV
jgi:hypothetical protein